MTSYYKKLDSELTVVLNIHQCPEYTLRWMIYNNENHFPFPIVIADGSDNKVVQKILLDKSKFPNLKYSYHYYENTKSLPYFRFKESLGNVKTEYVLRAANDDFFIIDGIRNALAIMSKREDLVSSTGKIYSCAIKRNPSSVYDRVYGVVCRYYPFSNAPSILEETAIDRVRNRCINPCANFYDIYRTQFLAEFQNTIYELNPKDIRFAAAMIDFMTVAEGKVHRSDDLYMLHQTNPTNGNAAKCMGNSTRGWIEGETWKADLETMVAAVADVVARKDQIPQKKAMEFIKDIYIKEFVNIRLDEEAKNTIKLNIRTFSKVFYKIIRRIKKEVFGHSRFKNVEHYSKAKPVFEYLAKPPKRLAELESIAGLGQKKKD